MNRTMKGSKTVKFDERGVEIGGKYEVLLCGSLFSFRLPRSVWRDRAAKLKAAGYNCADVYFPWNYHEREDGSFDFSGERDVRAFLQIMKEEGLYVIARPGPYICSEWDGGAIPSRILESGMPIRCADPRFLAETEKWYAAILKEISPFTYENGGSVIMLQLDNELDFFDCPDPDAYISALYTMAKKYISVPFICCAGQYSVERAGGFTEGVEATLNCYPDSADCTFDDELQQYALRFAERKKPLLVSETNRDHFLLRRELSCGSKLLGAYNQVAGMNFDFHQAVNNWGSPDSLIVSEYDFASMIDIAGGYHEEAEESVLFSAFLKAVGEPLSAAVPAGAIEPSFCGFMTAKGGMRVLALDGGGYAVCVPNFSEKKGKAEFTFQGRSVKVEVSPAHAPFVLFGLDLSYRGVPAVLTRANCEPISISSKELVFCGEGEPEIGLDFGNGEVLLRRDGSVNGVKVRFVDKEEGIRIAFGGTLELAHYSSRPIGEWSGAALPAFRTLPAARETSFGALSLREGTAEYRVKIPAGKALFVEHPCDLLRITADGVRGEKLYADGRDIVVPPAADGEYVVSVEKWGHSNFDDPQSPALRASCKKGATSFGVVTREEKIARCDFRLLNTFGEETTPFEGGFPVRIGVEKWNSTRKPVICSYTTKACREAERLLLKTTEETDVAVYWNGALLGFCDFGTFELTSHVQKGEWGALTLVYRKKVWTQNVGSATLLHIDPVCPSVSVLSEEDYLAAEKKALSSKGEKCSVPAVLQKDAAFLLNFSVEKEGYFKFYGKNVKLTCVANGRVVGRLFLDWEKAPSLQGGTANVLYVSPEWSAMYLVAEALAPDARLDGAEYQSC